MDDEMIHAGHSYADQKTDLLHRLRRIEGQVRGIHKMIENDRYCVDILIQLSAIKAGLNKVSLSLLEKHTQGCVTNAIKEGNGEASIKELMDVINQIVK